MTMMLLSKLFHYQLGDNLLLLWLLLFYFDNEFLALLMIYNFVVDYILFKNNRVRHDLKLMINDNDYCYYYYYYLYLENLKVLRFTICCHG
jgi:hypothetical protein